MIDPEDMTPEETIERIFGDLDPGYQLRHVTNVQTRYVLCRADIEKTLKLEKDNEA